jgi:hypothetical protein
VKSAATRRFWELFQALPSEVQNLAVKNLIIPPSISGVCREAKIASAFASEITIAPSAGSQARR